MPTAPATNIAVAPEVPPALPTQPPRWLHGTAGWDTHAHVFGPLARFPYIDGRRYTPPEQAGAAYLANLDTLGLRHGVLVQPSVHGSDNGALLQALRQSNGRLLGVIDIDARHTPDTELADAHEAGARGVRLWWNGAATLPTLQALAARLRGSGWHLDVFCTSLAAFGDLAPHVDSLPMPLMVEAMGTPQGTDSVSHPAFQRLLALLREQALWVKLSHPYKIDPAGWPYAQAQPFAHALAQAGPTQLVWGSDWPHPNIHGPMPNDGALLDLLPAWAGSEALARRILADNPARFYRFQIHGDQQP